MKKILLSALSLFFATAGFAVNVTVSSPTTSSTSPVKISASASSTKPISGWHVYVDGKDSYTGPASSSINTSISTTPGTHQFVIRAWDSSGAFGDKTMNVNVTNATSNSSTLAVKVSTPTASTVTSPFALSATASGPNAITGWHVYVDGKDSYTGAANSTVSTNLSAASGSHSIVVRAWDTSGAYADQTFGVTVSGSSSTGSDTGSSALPTPPSTAKVWSNIDQMTGWGSCGTAACAGGSGRSNYWQALNQTSPSMDGSSMQLFNSGVWANSLWWKHLGANDSATNMLWDFWVYFDGTQNYAQTFEFDPFQFVGGYRYMIGTQCNYAYGVWDTWNEAKNSWVHNYNLPCPKFSPNTWHHIQMWATMNHTNHTYTYKTFVIDGKPLYVNQTQPARYLGWASNLGVQWQIDVNASGAGVHEWVDKAKLTIW